MSLIVAPRKLSSMRHITDSEVRAMTNPFHVLKHEHRVIERALRALEGVCLRLEGGYEVPHSTLYDLAGFISSYADLYHHGKEETCLFPVLEMRGIPRQGGCLGVIEGEHEAERKLVTELYHSIESYKAGDQQAVRRFIEAGRTYTRTLIRHIEKEESILFMISSEVLDETDKEALMEAFKQAEGRLGADKQQECERLASELEEKWAI
jgi:hemerythrin-like domain-containing protein